MVVPRGKRRRKSGPTEADLHWMGRCLELARKAEGRTSPNPLVGCVILGPDGTVVAEGYHKKAGTAHAEAVALAKLRGTAKGCTMYVNLEPCAHRGKRRTAPCAPLVREAGIARLVIGMKDPIPDHSGGAAWLRRHGVDVVLGVRRDECLELNRAFVTWAQQSRPLFVLKAGMTLDGRVATRTGESKWITGEPARRDAHRLRAALDGILVGVETVRADDPALTVRGIRGAIDPVRIVLDSRLRTPPKSAVLPANSASKAGCIIVTTKDAPAARERRLVDLGAQVWRLPAKAGRVDVAKLAPKLAAADVTSVLVEGGGTVHASMFKAGLVDEVQLYVAPVAFGGDAERGGPAWLGGGGIARIAQAHRLQFAGPPRMVGDDLVLTARPRKR